MVFDSLENASRYYGLGPRFKRALEWLRETDLLALAPGERTDILGEEVYAARFSLETLPAAHSRLEAHCRYADIQYLVWGSERMGYAPAGTMEPVSDYDSKGDIGFYNGAWDTLRLTPGCFYIVWPGELHAPRVADNAPGRVERIVIKVKL